MLCCIVAQVARVAAVVDNESNYTELSSNRVLSLNIPVAEFAVAAVVAAAGVAL